MYEILHCCLLSHIFGGLIFYVRSSITLISGLSSSSAVPSTTTTSSPCFVSSKARVTRAFVRRFRIFCFCGWLKMSTVFPSHKNQTGTVYGRPSDPTVVSQPIMLVRKRCSACFPHSVVTSSIYFPFLLEMAFSL